jgi:dTDP-4-dehydrorhamnose 3,5-epimerase
VIDGVKTKQLRVIPDQRGRLMEILRRDDELFEQFGQAYMTTAYPGVVKAWHYHRIQSDNFAVVHGMMEIALYDSREGSPTKGEVNVFRVGVHNPMLVHIPPLVYHGFKSIGEEEAIIVNLPTEVYNYQQPDEYRLDAHDNDIPHDWSRRDG